MITFKHKGNFENTKLFIEKMKTIFHKGLLDYYGQLGVAALYEYTPKDTGKTAASWDYEIEFGSDSVSIFWTNDNNAEDGTPIVLLLQYGHITTSGYYIEGRDFINPALKNVFRAIGEKIIKEADRY